MKPITIVGGGLAGLALGIGLRRRNVPVTIWEAGRYPRHRVCGEFINGRGLEALAQFGLRDALVEAGGTLAQHATFASAGTQGTPRALPSPALCLSRFVMDGLLARYFQQLGGELKTNARYTDDATAPGVVRASGRRLKPSENGWRWFGLKAHAANVRLSADLEMHVWPGGYVGLCRLQGGKVNVCGLFRRKTSSHQPPQAWREILCGTPNSILHQRLSGADLDETSFCSVAGISLNPERASNQHECCIGDALTMIPPVTGNGMSMAFESAALALDPLCAYSRGELAWRETRDATATACDDAFARRLAWAKWLQWMLFRPLVQGGLGLFALRSEWIWRLMFSHTR